jgi:hypothetical protein
MCKGHRAGKILDLAALIFRCLHSLAHFFFFFVLSLLPRHVATTHSLAVLVSSAANLREEVHAFAWGREAGRDDAFKEIVASRVAAVKEIESKSDGLKREEIS